VFAKVSWVPSVTGLVSYLTCSLQPPRLAGNGELAKRIQFGVREKKAESPQSPQANRISCWSDPIPHQHQEPGVGAPPPQYYSHTDQGRMLHSNLDDNASSTLASRCICRPRQVRSCGTGLPVHDLSKHNSSACLFHKFQMKSIPNRHRMQTVQGSSQTYFLP
jgi:hypothetical protein